MKQNDIYHALITNLEGAINELETQIYKDMFQDATRTELCNLKDARESCRYMTFHKCRIINKLRDSGLLVYNGEPF